MSDTMTEEAPPNVDDDTPPDRDKDGPSPTKGKCRYCAKPYASRGSLWKHETKCALQSAVFGTPADQDKGGESEPKRTTTPRERKPRTAAPPGKRHDASGFLGGAWGTAARFVPSLPAQRAMAWQAPGAGRILDKALAGTVVDKWVLQKVGGYDDKYGPLLSLVSLPVMLVIIERQPAMLPVLAPQLRSVVKDNLAAALDAAAAERRQTEELQAKAEAAGIEWESIDPVTGERVDIVDALIQDLLGRPQEEPQVAAA